MLESLRFVQGAVAKKDFSPALTHFRIQDGFVYGYNGRMSLCSPIDTKLNVSPKAEPFVRAISTCQSEPDLSITKAGKLAVKSGSFKAYIDCTSEPFPELIPEGDQIEIDFDFLDILRKLLPFTSEDATRPWAQGVLLTGDTAYATNNVVLIEHRLPKRIPIDLNLPRYAIAELLRIGKAPSSIQINENNVTFFLGEGRWLKSQLFETKWPDAKTLLDTKIDAPGWDVRDDFFAAVQSLAPFTDEYERLYVLKDRIATAEVDGDGASIELNNAPERAVFNIYQLLSLRGIAKTMALDKYPAPCPFTGDAIRGLLSGMRV